MPKPATTSACGSSSGPRLGGLSVSPSAARLIVDQDGLGSELFELAGTLDWMNITGPPLKGLLREYALTADDLILVHDDLDLDLGRLRIKQAGGHGGHNGIKSVIDAIGTPQFVRVKIGIGRPAPRQDSADYVLQMFTKEEIEVLNPCLDRAVDALECLMHRGVAVAMNEFNVREQNSDK